jgi:hypothetical protein
MVALPMPPAWWWKQALPASPDAATAGIPVMVIWFDHPARTVAGALAPFKEFDGAVASSLTDYRSVGMAPVDARLHPRHLRQRSRAACRDRASRVPRY